MQLRIEIKNDDNNPEVTLGGSHAIYTYMLFSNSILYSVVNWATFLQETIYSIDTTLFLMAKSDVISCRAVLVIWFQYKGIFRCYAEAFSKRQVFFIAFDKIPRSQCHSSHGTLM